MKARLRALASQIAHRRVIRRSRTAAALFVAPYYHERISGLNQRLDGYDARLHSIEQHMPAVLSAIASVNGSTRLLRRELEAVRHNAAAIEDLRNGLEDSRHAHDRLETSVEQQVARLDAHVRDELWPLIAEVEGLRADRKTVEWLIGRVESVRAELMYEMRYGRRSEPDVPASARIIDEARVEAITEAELKVNLGCGTLPLDGYVNVDMRELPGVDVVAHVDDLPFERESVHELASAHTLEHFPQEQLVRELLPYWRSLLVPGGVFRAVVPDLDAMMEQLRLGEISFDDFRLVAYGGQEYEGDFHHTGFTPESLTELLADAGFVDVRVVERGRPNGDCLEFELTARRPS